MSLKKAYDQIIPFKEGVWLNQIPGFEEIPSNIILDKAEPGLGATYSEVVAHRSSIIMLPHVSIIKNKHEKYREEHNTFPVYGDGQITKLKDIVKYLQSDIQYKKFLTTPKGLEKIKAAFQQVDQLEKLFEDYFLLVDECQKWVKDTGYRDDMISPMDDFFLFKSKAMVSATPIPLSDPRVKEQGFKFVLLRRTTEKKVPIKLILTESVTNSFKNYTEARPNQTFCIFFNSISGIKSIITELDLLDQSQIFCSSESATLLEIEENGYTVSDEFTKKHSTSLLKYNFFTSSFFAGLDIDLDFKPNIVILTDCSQAPYSIADPFTDVRQIIGRFRNDMYDEVVHFNNYKKFTHAYSEKELEKHIEYSKIAYIAVEKTAELACDDEDRKIIRELSSRLYPYASFLDLNNTYSAYKEDNYRNENRVKSYYTQPYKLITAYKDCGFFDVFTDRNLYEKSELIQLKQSGGKYSQANNRMVTEALEELSSIIGTHRHYVTKAGIEKMFPILVEAYDRFGKVFFKAARYRIKQIKKQMILDDKENKRNSFALIDLVYLHFKTGKTYTRVEIKATLQDIYDEVGLDLKAKASHIESYFSVKYKNAAKDGKSQNAYILINKIYNNHHSYNRK